MRSILLLKQKKIPKVNRYYSPGRMRAFHVRQHLRRAAHYQTDIWGGTVAALPAACRVQHAAWSHTHNAGTSFPSHVFKSPFSTPLSPPFYIPSLLAIPIPSYPHSHPFSLPPLYPFPCPFSLLILDLPCTPLFCFLAPCRHQLPAARKTPHYPQRQGTWGS